MGERLFRGESAVEYFKELVEAAVERQRLEADELTSFYVVNLLAGCVRLQSGATGWAANEPLGLEFVKALHAAGSQQRDGLRRVGDASLFVTGFFSDSLKRRLVDIDYYTTLGVSAYGALGQGDDLLAPTFAELADKFVGFVDVLADVSGRSGLTSNADLLRLYERWVLTRSRHAGTLLAERGIVPNEAAPTKFVQ